MISGLSITGVFEVVEAFLWRVGFEQLADGGDEGFEGARGGFAQQVLQLGEDLFDRVQIGRVFGQEEQFGAHGSDRPTNGFSFVAAEIVHHDDVPRQKRGRQHGLDIGFEALAVDRTVENPGRFDAIMPKGGYKGHGFPMAVRNFGDKPVSSQRPSPQRRHVGLCPCLVDEDQALRRDPALTLNPSGPPLRHVGTIAFAGHDGFF